MSLRISKLPSPSHADGEFDAGTFVCTDAIHYELAGTPTNGVEMTPKHAGTSALGLQQPKAWESPEG